MSVGVVARTRSSGVVFKPPTTHDMVRSLFDPTVKKSFLEVCITLALLSDFAICHLALRRFGLKSTRTAFLVQYLFWRVCYNLGIGIVLHLQSRYETLSNYAKRHRVFVKGNQSPLAKFCQFELSTKMPTGYDMYSQPEELNVWLLFRQFVDLILMQDFCTYVIYVYLSLPAQWSAMVNWKAGLGVFMILFNIWVKVDAHRVVKDYAWYWGDFFFLQESELVFDGVFNISPHPMYSIGYMGYYGLSLICGDYHVLLVSILGHLLQFLFLKYVESPHMELIYGSDIEDGSQINSHIDDLIAKKNYDYSRPLINSAFWVVNFDKLRFTDYFTIGTSLAFIAWFFLERPGSKLLFSLVFSTKLASSIVVFSILYLQSAHKWFTKVYLKNGYTQVYSYQQWQFIYNFSTCLTYTLLFIQTLSKMYDDETYIDYTQTIFGLLLCALQTWCNSEIRSAISDFGWFYGDFFLSNYITNKNLTSQGIYRYLNNPETILGVAGTWGTVLMTNFSWENIILAGLWTACNFVLIKFIEEPHMAKLYGGGVRVSGIEKTLQGLGPWRRMSEIVDRMENIVLNSLTNHQEPMEKNSEKPRRKMITAPGNNINVDSQDWEEAVEDAIESVTSKLAPNCKFDIEGLSEESFILPKPVTVHWQLPSQLFQNDDWIGLYNIMRTRNNSKSTKVSSAGHWSPISPEGYPGHQSKKSSIMEFEKNSTFAKGKITFDSSLLHYEPGIYEFRYHTGNSHKAIFVSKPFELALPKLDIENPETLNKQLLSLLTSVGAVKNGKFDSHGNKYFSTKIFRRLVKDSLGVELSTDYINRVNGDIGAISQRICHIKSVLDDLD
ncbi:CHO2 (YGR157W) [Zygosaccharomyces parabailii]|nr:CHO2 (YGR157W) [Zygosaccharomyces parabailii]CDH13585.1 probable Phosphatidylethanolamine N-methyltransferase [Zygosaccharomyces bailii ISA1307]